MKRFFSILLFVFVASRIFASSNIYYNHKIKNAKNFQIDIDMIDIKSSFENLEYLKNLGVVEDPIFHYFTEISFDEGSLLIFWKYQQEYVSDDYFKGIKYIDDSRPGFRLYFKNTSDFKYVKAIDQNYFKVGDRTEKADVFNLKAEKLNSEDDNIFKEYIKQYQVINFLNKNIVIPLILNVVPFKTLKKTDYTKSYSSDRIIEIFGLPDLVESYFFKWPDQKSKNGLYYSPKVNYAESGEHWRYKKYPDLVIDISSGKVRDFATNRNQKFYEQQN